MESTNYSKGKHNRGFGGIKPTPNVEHKSANIPKRQIGKRTVQKSELVNPMKTPGGFEDMSKVNVPESANQMNPLLKR